MNIDIFFVPAFSLFVYWHVQFYCCHSETKKGVNPDWPSRSWRRIRHWLFPSPSFSLDSLKHTDSRGSLLHWNNIDQYLSLLSRLTTDPTPPSVTCASPKMTGLHVGIQENSKMYCHVLFVFTCQSVYVQTLSGKWLRKCKTGTQTNPPGRPPPPCAHTHRSDRAFRVRH